MKLFKHYKNKPYKFLEIVKHSETLEELVLYKTLYKNPSGELWVRPKEMFFESILLNENKIRRFAPLSIDILEYNKISKNEIQLISILFNDSIGNWDEGSFLSKFNSQDNYLLLIAYIEDRPVGFKLGYRIDDNNFYSWLGGVVSDYRRCGVAQSLLDKQHDWCKKMGFKKIQTKSQNKYKEMISLNIKNGFEIVGTEISKSAGLKILFNKDITN